MYNFFVNFCIICECFALQYISLTYWLKLLKCVRTESKIVGRFHDVKVEFCECHSENFTLILLGFWPAVPFKPRVAFSLNLLTTLHIFMLEGHMSVKSFVQCLKWRNKISNVQVCFC